MLWSRGFSASIRSAPWSSSSGGHGCGIRVRGGNRTAGSTGTTDRDRMLTSTSAMSRLPSVGRINSYLSATREEIGWIIAERARALREAPGARLSDDGRYTVGPVGRRGRLHVHRRDRDGSIVVAVRITDTGGSLTRYVRRLRCPQQGSPADRMIAFRLNPLT